MKSKIHPTSVFVAVRLVWKFGVGAFLSSVVAVTLHEVFHAVTARTRGYPSARIIFLPYGATLYNDHDFDKTSNVIIALSGPLASLLLALFTMAIWWIFPESFSYLHAFFLANLTIGLFNLLPVSPLDGGRVVLAICGYKPKAQKALKIFSFLLAFLLIAFYVFTLKSTPNFTCLIMAVFLLIYNLFPPLDSDYNYVKSTSPLVKNYDTGVVGQNIYIDENATLQRVLCIIKPDYRYVFHIMRGDEEVKIIDENDMQQIILRCPLNQKIADAIPRSFQNL